MDKDCCYQRRSLQGYSKCSRITALKLHRNIRSDCLGAGTGRLAATMVSKVRN